MNPKRIIKKANVTFISLVPHGANQKTIIYKSNEPDNSNLVKEVLITKVNEEQRLVYGIVYSPDEIDAHGDTASAEVIKQMAYDFMKDRKTDKVDKIHNEQAGEGFVAESWLTKDNDAIFNDAKPGSWAVAIKIEKDETWDQVKSGEIKGLSMQALASVETVKSDLNIPDIVKEMTKELVSVIKSAFGKNKTDEELTNQNGVTIMQKEEVIAALTEAIKPLQDELSQLKKVNEELKTTNDELKKSLEDRIEKIEKSAPISTQIKKEESEPKSEAVNIWL